MDRWMNGLMEGWAEGKKSLVIGRRVVVNLLVTNDHVLHTRRSFNAFATASDLE